MSHSLNSLKGVHRGLYREILELETMAHINMSQTSLEALPFWGSDFRLRC